MRNSVSRRGFTVTEIAIVVLLFVCLVLLGIPGYISTRDRKRMLTCQENLTKIDGAKEQWALATNQRLGTEVDCTAIINPNALGWGYLRQFPVEPSGGSYVINPVGTDPICDTDYPDHSLSATGEAISCWL